MIEQPPEWVGRFSWGDQSWSDLVRPKAVRGLARGNIAGARHLQFDPDQPRDEAGRWAAAGGSSDGVSSSAAQIKSPAFKAWFGDWEDPHAYSSLRDPLKPPVSQASNKDGSPKVYYHGTTAPEDFDSFKPVRSGWNSNVFGSYEVTRHGIFFTGSPSDADAFTEKGGDDRHGRIMPVYLQALAPIDFTHSLPEHIEDDLVNEGIDRHWLQNYAGGWDMFDDENGALLVAAAKRSGYDSIFFTDTNPDTRDSMDDVVVVFDQSQVKSAIGNAGTFDPKDSRIHMSGAFSLFDESQPRDGNGRWTDGVASSGSSSSTTVSKGYTSDGPTDPNRIVERLIRRAQGMDKVAHEDYQPVHVTTEPNRTKFLLPDGTRLTGRGEHSDIVFESLGRKTGSKDWKFSDVLDAGVVRYSAGGGIQISQPLTETQAETIADDWNHYYSSSPLIMDAAQRDADGKLQWSTFYKEMPSPVSAEALRRASFVTREIARTDLSQRSSAFSLFDETQPRDDHGRWTDTGADNRARHLQFDPDQPRDDHGRWSSSGGNADTSTHRVVRSDRGIWGASHGNSKAMTATAAEIMGIHGYPHVYEPNDFVVKVATNWLQRIADDAVGSEEPLYHGFQNTKKRSYTTGETVEIPLTATSGDKLSSAGYGNRLDRADQEGEPTLFVFPRGTQMLAYSKWNKEDEDEDGFDYVYEEAVVAGRFEVLSSRVETLNMPQHDSSGQTHEWHPTTDYRVVTLWPTHVFDPTSGEWKPAPISKPRRDLSDWDETQHPRVPAGEPGGGQFTDGTSQQWLPDIAPVLTANVLQERLEENPPDSDYADWLKSQGVNAKTVESLNGKDTIYAFEINGERYVLEDGDDRLRDASDWVRGVSDPTDWVDVGDFNKDYWEAPGALYHNTQTENEDDILRDGLEARSQTRGLTNRSVGAAVFTTDDQENFADWTYGDTVFEIDTAAMKRDGFMPTVAREPAAEEKLATDTLAWRLGVHDYDSEDYDPGAADERTVIVYDDIPAKYLKKLSATPVHAYSLGWCTTCRVPRYDCEVSHNLGGDGSGFFDHGGRPGLVGGSAPRGDGDGGVPKDAVALFRGDALNVSPSLSYADPKALFGTGIYLTDSKRIARDYTAKGSHDGVKFRYNGGSKGTKADAIDAYKRQLAQFLDKDGKELRYAESLPSLVTNHDRIARLQRADEEWERIKGTLDVRKQADGLILIREKSTPSFVSSYHIPKDWIAKTLDAEEPISRDVAGRLHDVLRHTSPAVAREMYAVATQVDDVYGEPPTYRDIYAAFGSHFAEDEIQTELRRALKDAGYKGIRYAGGVTMGGATHTAYVFWDEQGLKKAKAKHLSDRFARTGADLQGFFAALSKPSRRMRLSNQFSLFDESQPRDENGRWTDSGSGPKLDRAALTSKLEQLLDRPHQGEPVWY